MINHQQFLCNHWQRARRRIPYEGEKLQRKINHIILLWTCFIDLCWCSHISYLICIYWRTFRTMSAIWEMRKNRAAFSSLKPMLIDWVLLYEKEPLCLDPLPAYIKWNTQNGWMELCPDSGHQNICSSGWLTGTYICLWRRRGGDICKLTCLRRETLNKSRKCHFLSRGSCIHPKCIVFKG